MKKKIASLLAVCMASTMLLAGCGGGNNGANSAEGGNGGDTGAKTELVMATGGETGTYYAVGNVMATALNHVFPAWGIGTRIATASCKNPKNPV